MTLYATLQKELHVSRLSLHHSEPSYFVNPQWRSLPPVVFVLYRGAFAVYCVVWLIWSAIKDVIICRQSYTFVLFLTNWILVALTIQTTLAAVSTFYHHIIRARHRRFPHAIDGDVDFPMSVSTEPMTLNCETSESVEVNVITDVTVLTPIHLRISWLLYEVSVTTSLSLSLLYWLLIYDGKFTDTKFNNNCVISILLLVDVFITKVPIRLLHGIYPVLLCLTYFVFNFAYCRLGGDAVLFPVSHQRIYTLLQWDKPLFPTIAGVIITFLLLPSIHMFWFSMFQFRVYLWKRYGQDDS